MSSLNKAFGAWRILAIADQTVALGWILPCSLWWSQWGRAASLTSWLFHYTVWPSASQLSPTIAAQPNPIQFSSFPIILSMHWHFYPPIKTFKGPLSKRKECCFNSVVAPCLGPFFSVCNQPTLASWLMFSSQLQAKRGPSHFWDIRQQRLSMDLEPSFHCPKPS